MRDEHWGSSPVELTLRMTRPSKGRSSTVFLCGELLSIVSLSIFPVRIALRGIPRLRREVTEVECVLPGNLSGILYVDLVDGDIVMEECWQTLLFRS
jgi:hypothetical protein